MNLMKIKLVTSILILLNLGCSKSFDPTQYSQKKMGQPARSDKNVIIPKQLVTEVEMNFLKSYRIFKPDSGLTDTQVLANVNRQFMSFDVYLAPTENKLALGDLFHFHFPRGGGVIDFSSYLTGDTGSFYLVVRPHLVKGSYTEEDLEKLEVYFLSNSKRREIAGEEVGNGCKKYMKMTEFFRKTLSRGGMRLNATEQRHVSAIAGSFYFFLILGDTLHLGSVSFEDTRFPDLQCQLG